jgi:hypothetical protein
VDLGEDYKHESLYSVKRKCILLSAVWSDNENATEYLIVLIIILASYYATLRRLHDEELYELYASPDIIRVLKLRRIRWAGKVARMGEMRNSTIFWGREEETIWKTYA